MSKEKDTLQEYSQKINGALMALTLGYGLLLVLEPSYSSEFYEYWELVKNLSSPTVATGSFVGAIIAFFAEGTIITYPMTTAQEKMQAHTGLGLALINFATNILAGTINIKF